MLRILIKTVKHSNQRCEAAGDRIKKKSGQFITVSDMKDKRYEFLVALHEMIEWFLCDDRGIRQKEVDDFNSGFELDRDLGIHNGSIEPGDDSAAPYHKEHVFATYVEGLLAAELGVHWKDYTKTLNNL